MMDRETWNVCEYIGQLCLLFNHFKSPRDVLLTQVRGHVEYMKGFYGIDCTVALNRTMHPHKAMTETIHCHRLPLPSLPLPTIPLLNVSYRVLPSDALAPSRDIDTERLQQVREEETYMG